MKSFFLNMQICHSETGLKTEGPIKCWHLHAGTDYNFISFIQLDGYNIGNNDLQKQKFTYKCKGLVEKGLMHDWHQLKNTDLADL